MNASCCSPERRSNGDAASRPTFDLKLLPQQRRVGDVVELLGGTFAMGTGDADANPLDAEGPVRETIVRAFGIGRYTVTVEEFGRFVTETGYRTRRPGPGRCSPSPR